MCMKYKTGDCNWLPAIVFGKAALITYDRIEECTIPDGLYKYEVSYEDGVPARVARGVWVNFYGTILVKEELDFHGCSYRYIDKKEEFIELGGKPVTFEEFNKMEVYNVSVTETLSRVIPHLAITPEEAIKEVRELYKHKFIILDSEDMCGKAEFEVM